jgi:metal-responsive CopG/Arc/MetJ family transcriptional regulator
MITRKSGTMGNKTRVTVSIDSELVLKLDAICKKHGKTRSSLIQRSAKRLVDAVEEFEDIVTEQFLVLEKEDRSK